MKKPLQTLLLLAFLAGCKPASEKESDRDDEDLSIPQIDYHMKGIIGFPVIAAMEEIRVSKDNRLFVPKKPRLMLLTTWL